MTRHDDNDVIGGPDPVEKGATFLGYRDGESWGTPLIRSACPSCGRVEDRYAGSWSHRTGGTLTARMACERITGRAADCYRTWAETVETVERVADAVQAEADLDLLDPADPDTTAPIDTTTGQAPVEHATKALVGLSRWIDRGNAHRDPEAIAWGRVAKIGEEFGEVMEAFIGYTGQNPRKGVTHTVFNVVDELLDVAVTALGAVEHLRDHDGQALRLLDEKIAAVATRAGVAL